MTTFGCEDVRDALAAGRSPSEPELAAHARGCTECTLLLADGATLGRSLAADRGSSVADATLWSALEQRVEAEVGLRAWLRSRPTGLRVALAGAGVVAVAALGLVHLRPDWAALPHAVLGVWLVAFVAAAWLAVRLALPMLGDRVAERRGAMLGAAFGLPAVYAFVAASMLGAAPTGPLLAGAFPCFSYGLVLSAPLVGLLWALDRGAGSRSRLLSAAAACGLAANAALLLHCSATDAPHLLVGHASVSVALSFLAVLALSQKKPA